MDMARRRRRLLHRIRPVADVGLNRIRPVADCLTTGGSLLDHGCVSVPLFIVYEQLAMCTAMDMPRSGERTSIDITLYYLKSQ
jgi:hypothetical protein